MFGHDHFTLFSHIAGLKVFNAAGYVHRDISTGNLLLCETDGVRVCKISDLEYARPHVVGTPTNAHGHKTVSELF